MNLLSPIRPPGLRPPGRSSTPRIIVIGAVGSAVLLLLGLLTIPMLIVGGISLFSSDDGSGCTNTNTVNQPAASASANSIPANYLKWYKTVGQQYGIPWTVLAGIGTVESDNGQSTLPGVHSGQNGFGAAGPMQIGIGGAATDVWGGAAIHPASEVVSGVATDEDGGPDANVYDPADAIAGAAKYLVKAGVQTDAASAVFAYNHLQSYVQSVLYWAGLYAGGNYSVVSAGFPTESCMGTGGTSSINTPNQAVATAISYAEQQLGKPYLWGGTGPDAFDCSGLVMMAYRAAGIIIPRTSEVQWTFGPRVSEAQAEPGDLVFFAGSDGTVTSPGHVGLVIGNGQMIEAFATGFPIRIATYTDRDPVGFTRPWANPSVNPAVLNGIPSSASSAALDGTG